MQLWHLTYSSRTRHALFPSEQLRRAALRRLLQVVAAEVVLFCLVDDHLHLVLSCDEVRAARLGRSVRLALRPLAATDLGPAHRRPVDGRSHLQWLVRYCLLQVEKHGIDVQPALWTGSCFQELIGARPFPAMIKRLKEALPRLRRRDVCELVGIAPTIEPVDDATIAFLGAGRLREATTATCLVGPELGGKGAPVMLAKRVYTQCGRAAGLSNTELGRAAGVSTDRLRRWMQPPVPSSSLRALRLRLALEQHVLGAALEPRALPAR